MKAKSISLNNLPIGKNGKIISLLSNGVERKRILDLGLVKGTTIEALQKSPSGTPTAYFVRGSVMAFRDDCTRNILVKA